mmetsp:Transcript_33787/g.76473  ORF Transcript_33787/g.76473 Transcript_33787/m.76473 type:complete len:214 (-) Transcript_33787:309-950(-)
MFLGVLGMSVRPTSDWYRSLALNSWFIKVRLTHHHLYHRCTIRSFIQLLTYCIAYATAVYLYASLRSHAWHWIPRALHAFFIPVLSPGFPNTNTSASFGRTSDPLDTSQNRANRAAKKPSKPKPSNPTHSKPKPSQSISQPKPSHRATKTEQPKLSNRNRSNPTQTQSISQSQSLPKQSIPILSNPFQSHLKEMLRLDATASIVFFAKSENGL